MSGQFSESIIPKNKSNFSHQQHNNAKIPKGQSKINDQYDDGDDEDDDDDDNDNDGGGNGNGNGN